jgi:hypothetical protein
MNARILRATIGAFLILAVAVAPVLAAPPTMSVSCVLGDKTSVSNAPRGTGLIEYSWGMSNEPGSEGFFAWDLWTRGSKRVNTPGGDPAWVRAVAFDRGYVEIGSAWGRCE